MNPLVLIGPSVEVELKLALPTTDSASLANRLARLPVLARRKPTVQHLHSVYYDTPDQILRQQNVSLRIRRVGRDSRPQWLQTLKTGARSESALSQRGEWESSVPGGRLTIDVLDATPWADIDPDGKVYQALQPAFLTNFERTSWFVRRRDGSRIEVALDIGQIVAGEKSAPVCELELELLAGQPVALFDLAKQIAATIAILPANISKAERGYALAQDCFDIPLHAQVPELSDNLSVPEAAGFVLREMFFQFTENLNALRTSDDPEVVHQARVGWRRFKSALRLFKPAITTGAVPSWQGLEILLSCLGELRDLDVAYVDTLPPLADAYVAGDPLRAQTWQAMLQALMDAAQLQRKTVRYALHEPTVGANLLAATQWLEELSAPKSPGDAGVEMKLSLQRWSRRRITRLHRQLKDARHDADSPESQHRVRILAKRLRYGIEALRSFLPKRVAKRWYQQAATLQQSLGATRDVMHAEALVAKLGINRELVEFLRGFAMGQTRSG
jgi:inorganic triphosphatase YgiF